MQQTEPAAPMVWWGRRGLLGPTMNTPKSVCLSFKTLEVSLSYSVYLLGFGTLVKQGVFWLNLYPQSLLPGLAFRCLIIVERFKKKKKQNKL